MIPVQKKVEPSNFDTLVRQPGMKFLRSNPSPTSKDWKTHRYWKNVSDEICSAYNQTCSYLGEWISKPGSIDHFIPKSRQPNLAYEWDNYRLCDPKINNYKGDNDVADPFGIKVGWFVLDLPSCLIKPGTGLSREEEQLVQKTIDILKLNDNDDFVQSRCDILVFYSREEVTFNFLTARYPFIASELQRQGIVETVKTMFKSLIS